MPKFIVSVREVHVQPYEVEAKDKEAAIKVVRDGGGDVEDAFEYSHTLDPEFWTVEEVPQYGNDGFGPGDERSGFEKAKGL